MFRNLNIDTNKKTIADLKLGETAIIKSVGDDSPEIAGFCLRLLEIGFTPGQEVTLLAKATFKDPVAVSIRGTIIALRKNEAECIKIG